MWKLEFINFFFLYYTEYISPTCNMNYWFTGNITMPHVKIINLHVDINMLLVNIIMFYVDLNNSHVNIFVLLDALFCLN